jgi:hypothetical protein
VGGSRQFGRGGACLLLTLGEEIACVLAHALVERILCTLDPYGGAVDAVARRSDTQLCSDLCRWRWARRQRKAA